MENKSHTKQNPVFYRKSKNPLFFCYVSLATLLWFLRHIFCSQRTNSTLLFTIEFNI